MNIAFFHELFYGGARRSVYELGKELSKKHTVDLFYIDEQEDDIAPTIFRRAFFFRFLPKEWTGNDWKTKLYKDSIELFSLYRLHLKIARLLESGKYDVVFVHPSKYTQAPFVLRFLKTKNVYFCQEPLRMVYDSYLNNLPNVFLLKKLYEQLARDIKKDIDKTNIGYANYILANSEFSKQNIKKAYEKKATVCYLGVDTTFFRPRKAKKEYDILFLGQKLAIEGYDLLQVVFSFFPKKPKVCYIERNKNGVGISDSQLVMAYNNARVVVALSRNEPFGLTVLEAASCGVPVVALNEGGFTESVVHGKTGFLVPPKPEQIYKSIQRLLDNPNRRNEMGQRARKNAVRNWTWEKTADRFLSIAKKKK